jgi:hypothetical protein
MPTSNNQLPEATKPLPDPAQLDDVILAIAAERGKTPQDILAEADQRIAEAMAFPGADCIQPDDLVDYQIRGVLPRELEAHVSGCAVCARLLKAAIPDTDRVRAFRRQAETVATKRRADVNFITRPGWRDWRTATAMLATAAMAILVIVNKQPHNSPPPSNQIIITARPSNGENTAPVTIRVHALQPTRITVTADAATAVAMASNPPRLNVTSNAPDQMNEHTQQLFRFYSRVRKLAEDQHKGGVDVTDIMKLCKQAASQEGMLSCVHVGNASSGTVRLTLDSLNHTADINLAAVMKDMQQNLQIIENSNSLPQGWAIKQEPLRFEVRGLEVSVAKAPPAPG